MEKFFVVSFFPAGCEEGNDDEMCYAEKLSFCRQERAEIFREKICEKRSTHRVYVYFLYIPANWSGEEIARWLEGAIDNGEIQPISHQPRLK